jgi:hypothetical protein
MVDEAVQGTKGLTQAEYVWKVVDRLTPSVEVAMHLLPPPDGKASSGVAAFIEAFVYLGVMLVDTMKIPRIDYVQALRTMAADIEMSDVNQSVGESPTAKKAAGSEEKVDF